jgi:hypothetical protein
MVLQTTRNGLSQYSSAEQEKGKTEADILSARMLVTDQTARFLGGFSFASRGKREHDNCRKQMFYASNPDMVPKPTNGLTVPTGGAFRHTSMR